MNVVKYVMPIIRRVCMPIYEHHFYLYTINWEKKLSEKINPLVEISHCRSLGMHADWTKISSPYLLKGIETFCEFMIHFDICCASNWLFPFMSTLFFFVIFPVTRSHFGYAVTCTITNISVCWKKNNTKAAQILSYIALLCSYFHFGISVTDNCTFRLIYNSK